MFAIMSRTMAQRACQKTENQNQPGVTLLTK